MTDDFERTISELVESTSADRTAIEHQLDKLTGYDIPLESAKETVQALYGDEGGEIFNIRGVGSLRGHFLLQAGYDTIKSIANSSESDLNAVRYLGAQSVPVIQSDAQKRTEGSSSTDGKAVSVTSSETSKSADSGPAISMGSPPAVSSGRYPETMTARDQWILWKVENDKKLPVAPWQTGSHRRVNGMDSGNWTRFETAQEWADKMPKNLGLGFVLTHEDPIVFVDYDHVRTDAGKIVSRVRRHIERLESYTAVSTSGTGIHVYAKAKLPDGAKSVQDEFEDGSIEVYDSNRFIAVTGRHLEGTPPSLRDAQAEITALANYFGTVPSSHPGSSAAPSIDHEKLADIEETTEIEHVFEAIRQVKPGDIRLRSTRTEERADGSISYDPWWANSKSGTRLAALDEFWIYRKGMYVLDALQVVALEEGIISSVTDYPSGASFWDAVEELRRRGAHIPRYKQVATYEPEIGGESESTPEANPNREAVHNAFNRGEAVRTWIHEADRTPLEQAALELDTPLIQASEALYLPPNVAYRTAELYCQAFENDLIARKPNRAALGASLELASREANEPRPLAHISAELDVETQSLVQASQQISEDPSFDDLVEGNPGETPAAQLVSYLGMQLGLDRNSPLIQEAESKLQLEAFETKNEDPLAVPAAIVYAISEKSDKNRFSLTDVANAARIPSETIQDQLERISENR